MPAPRDHAARRNALESILRHIPGFHGYLEKQYRRESDELVRRWMADRLQRSKQAIDGAARSLADAGQVDVLPQLDRLRASIDKLIGRIGGAMRGYSGVFDLVRVREDLLDRVYDHDVIMMDDVDALGQAVEKLPAEAPALAAMLPEVRGRIEALEAQWDAREDLLKGLE
jgi:hypothetical protein